MEETATTLNRVAEALVDAPQARDMLKTLVLSNLSEEAGTDRSTELRRRVHQALQYIEAHYREPLPLPRLCQEMGVSRGWLFKHFRAEVGCTVGAYIRRRRVRAALQYLLQTNLPMMEVARQSGFQSERTLRWSIRRELAKSPRSLRRSRRQAVPGSGPEPALETG